MDNALPIVVGGCYRSGTSLVRRLLNAHPRIHCGPEVKFFRDFYSDYIDVEDPIEHLRFMNTARPLLPEEELLQVFGAALIDLHERAARAVGKPRWADKVPENVVFLNEWERLLGDRWVFLHVVRGPLDTLASIEKWPFPKSIPPGLDERIGLYVEYAEAGLRFAETHPDRYVRVVYEDLVENSEATARELMEDLGERFCPEQLAINAASHQTGLEDPKVSQTSEIHRDSVGGWRRVLSNQQAETIARWTEGIWSRLDPEGHHPITLSSQQ